MKRLVWLALLTVIWVGCVDYGYRPAPGPRPIPEPSRPRDLLRAELSPSHAGTVLLDEHDGLSPDEAAILAVDRNPRLRAVRAERGIGEAELVAAGVLPNPRLGVSVDVPLSRREGEVLGYGADIAWNVTPLLSRGARVSGAEENLKFVDLDIAWQEWQVAQAARLHTVRAIYLERRTALARELEQTWQARLDALLQARTESAVTELEVTNAKRALSSGRVERLELEQRLVNERGELSRVLGIDAQKPILLDTSFAPPPAPRNPRRFIDELPRRRLDLIALQHAQRSHDEALRAAVIAEFPAMELGLHAERDVEGARFVGASLSFQIPFFDRNQGAVARRRAERVVVEAEYAARSLEARSDVVRISDELGLATKELAAAREGSEAAGRLAEQARAAALGGALSPLLAADILERSYASRLRVLELEQNLAELDIALAVASGSDMAARA